MKSVTGMLHLHKEEAEVIIEKRRGSVPGNPASSILIPTWNNLEMLRLCIRSIEQNSALPHQIVLHVNQGADGTLDWARERGFSYTASAENIGVCHALNAARTLAAAERMIFFNDDMYACPGWDSALMDEADAVGHERFMLSGTLIEPMRSSNPCVIVADYGRKPEEFREDELLRDAGSLRKDDWQGSTWPPSMVHRDLWDLVGGMSTEFFPGFYSDPDLSMKLWQTGVRFFKGVGASRVYHFRSGTTRRVRFASGRRVFARKWGMTAGVFTKQYLRRGQPWDGPLREPAPGLFQRLKNGISRGF